MIPQATVTISNVDTSIQTTVQSDSGGSYVASGLPFGHSCGLCYGEQFRYGNNEAPGADRGRNGSCEFIPYCCDRQCNGSGDRDNDDGRHVIEHSRHYAQF